MKKKKKTGLAALFGVAALTALIGIYLLREVPTAQPVSPVPSEDQQNPDDFKPDAFSQDQAIADAEARLQTIQAEINQQIAQDQKPLKISKIKLQVRDLEKNFDEDLASWWPIAKRLRESVQRGKAPPHQKNELLKELDSLLNQKVHQDIFEPGKMSGFRTKP
jgi:hypothetical protein